MNYSFRWELKLALNIHNFVQCLTFVLDSFTTSNFLGVSINVSKSIKCCDHKQNREDTDLKRVMRNWPDDYHTLVPRIKM
jgi:hypothetical protein